MNKLPGDWWQKFAQLRLLFGYQYTHPGKKLNFMGAEIAQWAEWSEAHSLDWHLLDNSTHQQVRQFVRDLNQLYRSEPALYERDFVPGGFQWIDANDSDNSIFTYMRFGKKAGDVLVIACNFTPVPRENYRVGVPLAGRYCELLNSDSEMYGGSNFGNYGRVNTDSILSHGFAQSLNLRLPPLGIVIFKFQNG
jgi:1,4-alpha-glucan branching enzyme